MQYGDNYTVNMYLYYSIDMSEDLTANLTYKIYDIFSKQLNYWQFTYIWKKIKLTKLNKLANVMYRYII